MTSEAFSRLTDDQKRAYIQEIAVKIAPKIRNFEYVHQTDIFYSMSDETTVDLALPSGTLWATCNIGASSPDEPGLYFQWGDISGYTSSQVGSSKVFDFITYKHCNGDAHKLTKYCHSNQTDFWDGSGEPDNKLILDQEDDVAYVTLGEGWSIPSEEQFSELINNTTHSWDTSRSGMTFTANGEELFLFGAGSVYNTSSVGYYGSLGYYWSRSLNKNDDAYFALALTFDDGEPFNNPYNYRSDGLSVRPVRNP